MFSYRGLAFFEEENQYRSNVSDQHLFSAALSFYDSFDKDHPLQGHITEVRNLVIRMLDAQSSQNSAEYDAVLKQLKVIFHTDKISGFVKNGFNDVLKKLEENGFKRLTTEAALKIMFNAVIELSKDIQSKFYASTFRFLTVFKESPEIKALVTAVKRAEISTSASSALKLEDKQSAEEVEKNLKLAANLYSLSKEIQAKVLITVLRNRNEDAIRSVKRALDSVFSSGAIMSALEDAIKEVFNSRLAGDGAQKVLQNLIDIMPSFFSLSLDAKSRVMAVLFMNPNKIVVAEFKRIFAQSFSNAKDNEEALIKAIKEVFNIDLSGQLAQDALQVLGDMDPNFYKLDSDSRKAVMVVLLKNPNKSIATKFKYQLATSSSARKETEESMNEAIKDVFNSELSGQSAQDALQSLMDINSTSLYSLDIDAKSAVMEVLFRNPNKNVAAEFKRLLGTMDDRAKNTKQAMSKAIKTLFSKELSAQELQNVMQTFVEMGLSFYDLDEESITYLAIGLFKSPHQEVTNKFNNALDSMTNVRDKVVNPLNKAVKEIFTVNLVGDEAKEAFATFVSLSMAFYSLDQQAQKQLLIVLMKNPNTEALNKVKRAFSSSYSLSYSNNQSQVALEGAIKEVFPMLQGQEAATALKTFSDLGCSRRLLSSDTQLLLTDTEKRAANAVQGSSLSLKFSASQ